MSRKPSGGAGRFRPPMDELTDREVARELRVHVRTVQRWCGRGLLEGAFKAGRRWRIPRAAVQQLRDPVRIPSVDDAAADGFNAAAWQLAAVAYELRELAERRRLGRPPPPNGRSWRAIAGEARNLERTAKAIADEAT